MIEMFWRGASFYEGIIYLLVCRVLSIIELKGVLWVEHVLVDEEVGLGGRYESDSVAGSNLGDFSRFFLGKSDHTWFSGD